MMKEVKETASPRTRDRDRSRAGWVRSLSDQPLSRVRFARSAEDAVIAGVAGGLGSRWGVDPVIVRIGFVVLSFAGAVGVIVYMTAWAVSLDPGDRRAPKPKEPDTRQGIAFGAIVLGTTLVLREVGLWLGDALGIPLVICAIGAGVLYLGTGRERRFRSSRALALHKHGTRPSLVGLIVGGVFVLGGVLWFVIFNRSFTGMLGILLAVAVTAMGLAIVFGPWIYRLANQVGDERRDRIRSEERAELAAHLHDSVLQTLALIQRNADSPRRMASLARRQERELRAWLYGQPDISGRIDTAIRQMADAVEETHDVSIETVLVGDCDLDERTLAVVHACREAVINAARHAGVEEIAVYVECEADRVTAYVRDRGKGFDVNAVPEGRRGITDSIKGRIERHGGEVTITAAPDEGCEVHIEMPFVRRA